MKNIRPFILDLFIWTYNCLVSYKIIYEKILLNSIANDFHWIQLIISFGFGIIISLGFFNTDFSLGRKLFLTKAQSETSKPFFILYLVLFLTFIASYFITQISVKEFFSKDGIDGAKRIFSALMHPEFKIFEEGLFTAIETIYMAFMATILSLPIAFILSFFAARNLMSKNKFHFFIYSLIRLMLNLTRSIEPLVWAIVFSVWVGIGPFSGMLALWLHSIASLTKLYSEQIEHCDEGPIEAITSTGAHPIQIVWFGIVPQVFIPFISYSLYRWDINVRMATVIGLVGGGGIGNLLMQYQGQARWNEVGMLVILIAIIVWIMDYSSSKLREILK